MAGQGIQRREALKIIALAAVVAQLGTFENWVFAHQEHQQELSKSKKPYKTSFFNKHEYLTLITLQELIIPRDDSPGARDAGVAEFTDFIISHDPVMQPIFRNGLKWFDKHARHLHNFDFNTLIPAQQTAILETLAYKGKFLTGTEEGRGFFKVVRRYTVMGYYTSRPGMEALGVHTLRATWPTSPECPHHDDPEHIHRQKNA